MKVMKKGVLIVILTGLLGCGTQPELSELIGDMVVLTNYESGYNYNQLSTYALTLDTVGLISNTSNNTALSNEYAKMITSNVKRNLDLTNRTLVKRSASPDLGVNITIVNDLSVSQSIVYPNYYYPSYYGYSGYYGYGAGYGYVSTSYFQQAALIIELIDLKNVVQGTNPKAVWVANIGDLVNSYDPSQKTREAIDQAFQQSPFLKR